MSDEQIPPPPIHRAVPPPPPPPYAPPPYAQPPYAQSGYPPAYAAPYAAPYAGTPRRSGWFWVAIIVGILAVVLVVFFAVMRSVVKTAFGDTTTSSTSFGSNSIAVVDISGVILDADKVDKQIDKFADDSSVKAIILHIDSPGGGAAASQEIYHEGPAHPAGETQGSGRLD